MTILKRSRNPKRWWWWWWWWWWTAVSSWFMADIAAKINYSSGFLSESIVSSLTCASCPVGRNTIIILWDSRIDSFERKREWSPATPCPTHLQLHHETWAIVVADLALSSTSPERQSDYGIAHWLWTREVDEKRAVLSLWYYIIYEFIGFLPRSFPSFFLSDRGERTSQKKANEKAALFVGQQPPNPFSFSTNKTT